MLPTFRVLSQPKTTLREKQRMHQKNQMRIQTQFQKRKRISFTNFLRIKSEPKRCQSRRLQFALEVDQLQPMKKKHPYNKLQPICYLMKNLVTHRHIQIPQIPYFLTKQTFQNQLWISCLTALPITLLEISSYLQDLKNHCSQQLNLH